MSETVAKTVTASPTGSGRSHLIFVGVGITIIVGGLWFLYDSTAPYHPDFPVTDSQEIQTSDS